MRIKKAFYLSIFGLSLAAALVVVLLIAGMNKSNDIVAVVGLFTTVLGTLVGAFFGIQIGAAGKERAEQQADNARKKVEALQAAADEPTIERAQVIYPDLFK